MEAKDVYADGLHFLGGWCAVLSCAVLWGHIYTFVCVLIAYAAFKEFYFDIHFEAIIPQTYLKGLRDFAGYIAGAFIAAMIWSGRSS